MLSGRIVRRAALLIALLAAPAPAFAQPQPQQAPGSTENQLLARTKGQEGVKLFTAERWQEAYDLLAEADKLYHAPTLVLYMARCQRRLGKLLEATGLYDRLLEEELPRDAPKAFFDAKDLARGEREALQKTIPSLRVIIAGVNAGIARVTVDGSVLRNVNKERKVNPGIHVVEVEADGAAPTGETITLAEGGYGEVKLVLEPRGASQSAPLKPHAEGGSRRGQEGSVVPAGIAFTIGAAGIAVGAAAGLITLNKVNDVKSRCNGSLCLASDKGEAETAHTLGNVSTAGFIAGGVGVAAGVVLLLVRPGGKRAAAPFKAGEIAWSAGVSPGRVDIIGRFQ